ncbi:MAG: aminotransferase class I/II-fold pyridoxal phosphate-dependent enzyme [Opitutus sp.]|nr:aminotransferase class I/II-fold pyridoxal phosphate-dependent enzyme [Opitutus sp.]MCS6246195.1 aminotransferase class I/II-fold pyridoxal phosphate-dependent enzyme [Opitutus sp.]MCS6275024.1 aminotransferase class I/II-fold pyridoxal phosphate-dependent enzyme [Opitutus sp.]MCS6278534.1 aminotransferase class I/II-fold pyridoxal phosphate-dependent enzyme [Opitutus sp.]MCS6300064.1 aminotransferase class I/II-fold pyridoxal phosphate-dependent enzyme [Opitutus sp.]
MSSDSKRWVASHVAALPKSGIRDFFELVAKMKGQDVISLGVGEPDFVTPWHVREAAIYALEKGKTYYTSNLGMIELRRAIAGYVTEHFSVNYRPEDEILVTVGVSEAIDLALRALCNPGDKVMYHQPCYVSYHPSVALVHAEGIAVPTYAKDGFALTAEALRAAWVPGCKILMLNLPCNPTGGTCSLEQLTKIAEFCREKDLLVLSDEIYSELTFDGVHTSIASLPGMAERTIFLHGFSKAFAMTGWRIGYACGPAPLIDAMMKVHQYTMLCASIIAQEAALEALLRGWDSVCKMRDQYHRRRDLVVRRFNEIGLTCHSPRGSFYAFPSVAQLGITEKDFAVGLLQQEKVAVVPGNAFGVNGIGHVRACFATSYEQLIIACDRMDRFVQGVKK